MFEKPIINVRPVNIRRIPIDWVIFIVVVENITLRSVVIIAPSAKIDEATVTFIDFND